MLLPGFSLADYEADVNKRNKDLSRGAKFMNEKQAAKDQANATSGQGKKVTKMLNRVDKHVASKIDYLTA